MCQDKKVFVVVDGVVTCFRMFSQLLVKLKMLRILTLSAKLFSLQMFASVVIASPHYTLQIKSPETISDFCISLFQALTH